MKKQSVRRVLYCLLGVAFLLYGYELYRVRQQMVVFVDLEGIFQHPEVVQSIGSNSRIGYFPSIRRKGKSEFLMKGRIVGDHGAASLEIRGNSATPERFRILTERGCFVVKDGATKRCSAKMRKRRKG